MHLVLASGGSFLHLVLASGLLFGPRFGIHASFLDLVLVAGGLFLDLVLVFGPRFRISDLGLGIWGIGPSGPNLGFRILWILDFGSLCSSSLCQCEGPSGPNFGF